MIKNFLFPKLKCSASRYFYQVLWQFLSSGFRFGIFGQIIAAAGGEMSPNYLKNRPPDRKLQARSSRLAEFIRRIGGLGDQIVRNFRGKKKFPIPLEVEKKNFHNELRVKNSLK